MSIAEQVQTIRHGLFTNEYQPLDMRQILDNGTQQVTNWGRIRPAVVALSQMPWCDLDTQWHYFLDQERYPIGRPMDLRPDEVGTFQNIVHNLISQTQEPMRVLMSVHPEISLNDVSVTIGSTDLETLEKAIHHVRRTTELAAIDDAITVSSLQPGSLDIFLTAGQATMLGIQLAILLARACKEPQVQNSVKLLMRLAKRQDNDTNEEESLAIVLEETQETFWESASDPLQEALIGTNVNFSEAQSKINQAAKEIYENAEDAAANWKLPPAVISGLPHGLTVSLHDSPEAIGRIIRELATPAEPD